jgi:hypothetical protein
MQWWHHTIKLAHFILMTYMINTSTTFNSPNFQFPATKIWRRSNLFLYFCWNSAAIVTKLETCDVHRSFVWMYLSSLYNVLWAEVAKLTTFEAGTIGLKCVRACVLGYVNGYSMIFIYSIVLNFDTSRSSHKLIGQSRDIPQSYFSEMLVNFYQ